MALRFHTAVLATSLAATAAVGIASAAIIVDIPEATAVKTDRMPVVVGKTAYLTIETRGHGVSVLKRIPID